MRIENKYCTVKHTSGVIHVSNYFESARVETQQTVNTYDDVSLIPEADVLPMPEEGERVEENKVYSFEGKNYHVVQPHVRTHYHPDETPALFAVKRDNPELEQPWIENEKVEIGWVRIYNDVKYECVQGHVTYKGYEPDRTTPTLWKLYSDEEIIDWYQPSGAHDAFRLGDLVRYTDNKVYESKIDYNTYSPEAYPAGWELREDLS